MVPVEDVSLREQQQGSGGICLAILRELPEWFGIEESVDHYRSVSDHSLTVVASDNSEDVGFLTLVDHGSYAAEIYVMAVRPAWHRRGVGRRLVERAQALAAGRGVEYLQVKTMSGRRADTNYAATRAFYLACGFRPLEELPNLWGPDNPALQLVKRLDGRTGVHHVELWVPDLQRAVESFGWLLSSLGYRLFQEWDAGRSWRRDGHYVVVEQSPALTARDHDRRRPGLNHLAFHAGRPSDLDRLTGEAGDHGWRLLFADRHPHAGGPDHYAAYLENVDGFEVELVADGLRSLTVPPLVTIRRMTAEDLPAVDRWLREPHVARWFLPETTADDEVEKYRRRVEDPFSATVMCTVELDGQPIGWCQWHRWQDYPADAKATGAHDRELGADYAIGDPAAVGHGVGTAMIATLVAELRRHHPRAGLVIAPEADNWASRRVLEKNGFDLVDVRVVVTEPHDRPMAVYRLGFTNVSAPDR